MLVKHIIHWMPSSYHTSQLVILTRANFWPHSCYWVLSCSCYRPIIQRLVQSVRPIKLELTTGIRNVGGHSNWRTFNTGFQSTCCMAICCAVESCWTHNPEIWGSKPRSANCFCISLTDVKFKMTPKLLRPNKKTPVFPVSWPYLDYRADPRTFYSKNKK
jgi:hypothetical protein